MPGRLPHTSPIRLVRGNIGGLRCGRHPQFRPATLSIDSRIEIGNLGTGTGVEGRRNTGTAAGFRWGRHVYLSYSCALTILIELALG
jgi:hypothetical protein